MSYFLWISTGLSFSALLFATLMERSAIVARINGANGMIILVFLIVSFLASLAVAVIAAVFGGWGYLWRVLGGSVLYHGAMGAASIGYLQWLATRTSQAFAARESVTKLAGSMRFSKTKD